MGPGEVEKFYTPCGCRGYRLFSLRPSSADWRIGLPEHDDAWELVSDRTGAKEFEASYQGTARRQLTLEMFTRKKHLAAINVPTSHVPDISSSVCRLSITHKHVVLFAFLGHKGKQPSQVWVCGIKFS